MFFICFIHIEHHYFQVLVALAGDCNVCRQLNMGIIWRRVLLLATKVVYCWCQMFAPCYCTVHDLKKRTLDNVWPMAFLAEYSLDWWAVIPKGLLPLLACGAPLVGHSMGWNQKGWVRISFVFCSFLQSILGIASWMCLGFVLKGLKFICRVTF